jgi:predicted O-methyltransferase YrrM
VTRAFLETIRTVNCAGGREQRYGEFLYGLVCATQPDTILEVGSWYGYSTLWMAEACKDIGFGKLYCVDNWSLSRKAQDAFHEAIHFAQVSHLVTVISGDSLRVEWPKVIDFAFIDGNHSYAYAKAECERAMSRGAKTIVLHDTTSWEGISRYVAELRESAYFDTRKVAEQFDILEISKFHGMTVLQKRGPKAEPTFTDAEYPLGYTRSETAA